MDQHSDATAGHTDQVRHTLYWAAGTLISALALWKIGDPWLVEQFGSGAPWWAYMLLCMRLVGGVVQMVVADAALRSPARQERPSHDINPEESAAPLRAGPAA